MTHHAGVGSAPKKISGKRFGLETTMQNQRVQRFTARLQR
jgi:hypothetical protein